MSYSFTTAEIPTSERFDYFQEAAAQSYIRAELTVPDSRSFNAAIQLKSIDTVALSVITTTPLHSIIPRPAREMSVPDIVFLQCSVGGFSRIIQDGREVETRAGEMALLDTSRSYIVDIPDGCTNLVLGMPRAELEYRIGSVEKATGRLFSLRTTEGALAMRYLSKLFANPPPAGSDAAAAHARQALDVTALALGGGSSDVVRRLSSPAAVSRLRLHHAIDTSISEGSRVSCEDVANMAGISMRYANLLLAQEGTSLERLIIQRRLECCCKMLSNPQLNHHRIGDIALASGFGSASHFARSFKESFGITAREFRNEPAHYSAYMLNSLPNLLQHLA